MVDRPTDIVRFGPDGSGVERLASFPQIPDLTTMTVLPDGRAVVPVRASSRVRLMVARKGKDPAPLVTTAEETAAPVAACGPREVALMVGPEPRDAIGIGEPASGRLVRTISPGKGRVDSMSCSPDGATVYFSARGIVWSVPASGLVSGAEPRKIGAGVSVVADPAGGRLIVERQDGSQLRCFIVPLNGATEGRFRSAARSHLLRCSCHRMPCALTVACYSHSSPVIRGSIPRLSWTRRLAGSRAFHPTI
jgi:hypothetical protein